MNYMKKKKKVEKFLNQAIAINFILVEKGINYPIVCMPTDNFAKIEEKLYIEYPDLRNRHIYFLSNGNIMDRSRTLEQNKIKNACQILINFSE